MSYLEHLLVQKEPLDKMDRGELEAWRGQLEKDCAMFGKTADDARRLNGIRRKLAEDSA